MHEFHIEFHVVFLCTYLLSGNEVDEGNGFPAPPLASGNGLDDVSFCLLIYFLDQIIHIMRVLIVSGAVFSFAWFSGTLATL